MRRLTAFNSLLAILVATAGHATGLPAGIWYHEGQPDNPNLVSVHELRDDGTFRFEFREYERCEIVRSTIEEGRWARKDDVITTMTESVNGISMSHVDAKHYTVEAESETEMRIRHLESDHLYIERRLEQAEFPGCFWGT